MYFEDVLWIVAAVLAFLVVWVFRTLAGSTIYFSHPMGYHSISGTEEGKIQVSHDRFERILHRFVEGDLFDGLAISPRKDEDRGIALSHEEGQIVMSCAFLRLRHQESISSFRERMRSLGYTTSEERPWNIGLGEDLESLTLSFEVEVDFAQVRQIAYDALEILGDYPVGDVFVNVWSSQDGPKDSTGIKIVRHKDLLSKVP